jgi:hypothetical protein
VPALNIVLGKDCVLTGSHIENDYVRNVSYQQSAKTVEYQPFGQRAVCVHNAGYDCTIEVEMLKDTGAQAKLQTGDEITISGSGYSGSFVIVNVNRDEPLDGAVSVRITAKLTSL